MPYTTFERDRVHYQSRGGGEPLLLVQGLGAPGAMWETALPWLADDFQCVWYDNPGTGGSDAPDDDAAYTISRMADIAAAVIEANGWSSAHVWGGSMGSMIALELALRSPQRVRSLVLGPASASARSTDSAQIEAVKAYMAAAAQIGSDPLGAVRQMIPFWYGEGFLEANPGVDELMAAMLADHPVRRLPALDGPHGLSSWSVQDRLAEIKVPTLVCHGVYDRLIPVAEGKAVFDGISGAELRLFHAVHSFSAHDKDSVIGGIAAWLQAHS